MTPAQVVVERFEGIRAAARALDVAPSTVLRWEKIPLQYIPALLKAAKRLNIEMTTDALAEALLCGEPVMQRRLSARKRGQKPISAPADAATWGLMINSLMVA